MRKVEKGTQEDIQPENILSVAEALLEQNLGSDNNTIDDLEVTLEGLKDAIQVFIDSPSDDNKLSVISYYGKLSNIVSEINGRGGIVKSLDLTNEVNRLQGVIDIMKGGPGSGIKGHTTNHFGERKEGTRHERLGDDGKMPKTHDAHDLMLVLASHGFNDKQMLQVQQKMKEYSDARDERYDSGNIPTQDFTNAVAAVKGGVKQAIMSSKRLAEHYRDPDILENWNNSRDTDNNRNQKAQAAKDIKATESKADSLVQAAVDYGSQHMSGIADDIHSSASKVVKAMDKFKADPSNKANRDAVDKAMGELETRLKEAPAKHQANLDARQKLADEHSGKLGDAAGKHAKTLGENPSKENVSAAYNEFTTLAHHMVNAPGGPIKEAGRKLATLAGKLRGAEGPEAQKTMKQIQSLSDKHAKGEIKANDGGQKVSPSDSSPGRKKELTLEDHKEAYRQRYTPPEKKEAPSGGENKSGGTKPDPERAKKVQETYDRLKGMSKDQLIKEFSSKLDKGHLKGEDKELILNTILNDKHSRADLDNWMQHKHEDRKSKRRERAKKRRAARKQASQGGTNGTE